jgi:hypothetical protein
MVAELQCLVQSTEISMLIYASLWIRSCHLSLLPIKSGWHHRRDLFIALGRCGCSLQIVISPVAYLCSINLASALL